MIKLIFGLLILKDILTIKVLGDIIDLTWSFGEDTLSWPGHRPFEIIKEDSASGPTFRYALNEYCTAEHSGTHFDAPYHFNQEGWKVADVPVVRLFAKGALIDLTNEYKQLGINTRLTVKHLQDWEKRNGDFQAGSVLLVKFGRSKYYHNRTKYFDFDNDNTTMNFPALSKEAAQWIVDSDKFYGVGLDVPSIDPGNSTDYIVHRTFAARSVYNLENVKLLVDLPEKGFDLIIAPTKLGKGTGAPVRIFAKIKDSS